MTRIEKLTPAFKDYPWGGDRLKTAYGKVTALSPLAESWELSCHPDGLTRTEGGVPLRDAFLPKEWGANCEEFEEFPLLVKLIDAKESLSVQVHPDDAYARRHGERFGKTETWYVVDAEEGAGIFVGVRHEISREELERAVREECLPSHLQFYPVKAGECYFIPAGTVHAIGRGCLICEVQQSSNLTYRLYDYGRVGKDGKPRELHVEHALEVARLAPSSPRVTGITLDGSEWLCASKPFTVERLAVCGEQTLSPDGASFRCFTCLAGEGLIAGRHVCRGESVLVSACDESLTLTGEMSLLLTSVRKYYVGIDVGGTFIKGGIVDDLGRVLVSDKTPTKAEGGAKAVAGEIAALVERLLSRTTLTASDLVGIGMGVPGMIDGARGEVVYANNLGWRNFGIAKEIEALTGVPTRITNDANAAALGEALFGAGRAFCHSVLLTLGTGVGGGIVLGGKLYEGNRGAGAELGHTVISMGGEPCTCGRRGCLEAYASATALIRDTRRAMEAHRESAMWELGSTQRVDGATAFAFMDRDGVAREVVEHYLDALACGIVNLCNELRPEAVILGGGICAEGERLTRPLQERLEREVYGGSDGPVPRVLAAMLGNRAGLLGAAALWIK